MKYFNRSFFRLAVGFLLIVALSLLLIVATSAYASGVERLVFTSEAQSIKPGVISDAIKVQFQDASGDPQSFGQTSKMIFKSSSPSGKFVSESGNLVSATINSNWTSRTFYYQDSSEGEFVLTVQIEGTGLEASQKIFVASGLVASANTADQSTAESSASSGGLGSSLSGPASGPSAELEVLAGSDRTTAPGSPITFQAKIKKNTTKNGVTLNWSYGDGNVGVGPLVSHTYKYPGEYAVILNARAGEIFAVSRLKVKVVEPSLKISDTPEYIEVKNEGAYEVNLFNWKIAQGYQSFIFQPDTIVLPKSSVRVDKNLLKLKSSENIGLALTNFLGQVVTRSPERSEEAIPAQRLFEIMPNDLVVATTEKAISATRPESAAVEPEDAVIEAGSSSQEIEVFYEAPRNSNFIVRAWQFLKAVLE